MRVGELVPAAPANHPMSWVPEQSRAAATATKAETLTLIFCQSTHCHVERVKSIIDCCMLAKGASSVRCKNSTGSRMHALML